MADDKKMERTMRFLLEQQARFDAGMQQIREIQQQVQEVLHTQSQAIVTTLAMIGKLGETQTALGETQTAHDARIATLETKMTELAEAGKATEDHLNAFITFVEKYISSRNGDADKAH